MTTGRGCGRALEHRFRLSRRHSSQSSLRGSPSSRRRCYLPFRPRLPLLSDSIKVQGL